MEGLPAWFGRCLPRHCLTWLQILEREGWRDPDVGHRRYLHVMKPVYGDRSDEFGWDCGSDLSVVREGHPSYCN